MKMSARKSGIRVRIVAAGTSLVALALLAESATADIKYNWQIAGNAYWSDNVFLESAGPDAQPSTLAFEINPAFQFEQESARLRSSIDYDLSYITYTEDLAEQQAVHNLDAAVEWSVIPGWFYLPAQFGYTQALIDPTGPGAYGGGLFGSGNLSDVSSYRVGPRLQRETSWGEISADYSVGKVDYSESTIDSAEDSGATLLVVVGDPEGSLSGRIGYVTQKTEYETAETYRFDTAIMEAGYRMGRDLRLLAQAGLESDIEASVATGGLDETFWRAGVEWQATRDNLLKLLVGQRFFGTTYDFTWQRTSRTLETEVRYTEDPTTQSREFLLDPFSSGTGQRANDGVPGSQGFGRPTADAFLTKRLEGSATLVGRLTRVGLRVRAEERAYFVDASVDRITEFGISLDRRFGPAFNARLGADRVKNELREGIEYAENRISAGLTRQFADSLSGEVEASYVERTEGLRDYDLTWIRVGVVKRFGDE